MSQQKVQKAFASQNWHDEYDNYKKCQFAKLNHTNGTTFWTVLCLFHLATLICQESAKLRALHTLAPMRLICHWYLSTDLRACAPYLSLICVSRACAFTCICPHQNVVLLQLKSKVCFMCAFQLTIHHICVSSVLFYHIKLFCMFFYFFCFES